MSEAFTITIEGQGEAKERLNKFGNSPGLSRVIGEAASGVVKENFFRLDGTRGNAMGGKRSHFYWDAAKRTSHKPLPDGAVVIVDKVGVRQRWLGGEIRAKNVKFLTIPARSESYGVPARQFPGVLKFIPTPRGGMLVKDNPVATYSTFKDASGQTHRKYGKQRKLKTAGLVMYWLVPSVYQRPDPSVIPGPDKILNAVSEAASKHLMSFRL